MFPRRIISVLALAAVSMAAWAECSAFAVATPVEHADCCASMCHHGSMKDPGGCCKKMTAAAQGQQALLRPTVTFPSLPALEYSAVVELPLPSQSAHLLRSIRLLDHAPPRVPLHKLYRSFLI